MNNCFPLGEPAYMMASLLQMSRFGGVGAKATKDGIDSIFKKDGVLELNDYTNKLISCIADSDSVNFGDETGLLCRLEDDDCPWLVKIHCINHCTELVVKNAFEKSAFNSVDTFYISLFNLLKKSGAIKSDIKSAVETLDINFYALLKLTGTQFVSH